MIYLQGINGFVHECSAVNISVAYRDLATVTGGKVLVFSIWVFSASSSHRPFTFFTYERKIG
jgi:hypothetical protein